MVHDGLHLVWIHQICVRIFISVKEELLSLPFLFLLILHPELPVALLYHLTDLVYLRFEGAILVQLV